MQTNENYSLGCLFTGRRYQLCFNMSGEKQATSLCVKELNREEISAKGTDSLQAPAYGFYPPFLD